MVRDGFGDGEVPLQGEDNRHEDGGEDGNALNLIAINKNREGSVAFCV